MRIIDGDELDKQVKAVHKAVDTSMTNPDYDTGFHSATSQMQGLIAYMPTLDAVHIPCKIGDYVWAIRNFHGHLHPQPGLVSDMFFTRNMELCIVVKYVARGAWGEVVFPTEEKARAAINMKLFGKAKVHGE